MLPARLRLSLDQAMTNDAFISYSHRADRELAAATETALERLARPLFAIRAIEVFRDASDLPASSGLGPALEAQLQASRWLIFFASPAAARSAYCNDELRWWVSHRGTEQLLLVLTDGMIAWDRAAGDFDWQATDALPPTLKGSFAAEPLYVDLREIRANSDQGLAHPGFRAAMLDLAAPIRGLPKNSLDSEDVRRQRQVRRLARGAVAAITLLGLAASVLAFVARQQAQISLARLLGVQAREVVHAQPDLGLLLAVESLRVSDTPTGRGAMLDALLDRPQLVRVLHGVDRSELERQGFRFLGRARPNSGRPQAPNGQAVRCDGGVEAAAVHEDGLRAAYGCYAGELRFADTSGLRGGAARAGHKQPVTSVLFTDDGRVVVTGGYDGRILLWHFASGVAMEPAFAEDELPVLALGLSADGRQLVSLHEGGPPRLWDLRLEPRLMHPLGGSDSPDEALEVLGPAESRSMGIIWHPGAALRLASVVEGAGPAGRLVGLRADGTPVYSTQDDGVASRTALDFDRQSGIFLKRVVAPTGQSSSLDLKDHSAGLDLRIETPGYPGAVAISPDRRRLVVAIGNALWMWSLPEGALLAGPIQLEAEAQVLRFDSGDAWLAAGLKDGRVQPLDPRTGLLTHAALDAHISTAMFGVQVMAASPDGKTLASGGPDGRIILWDTSTWKPRTSLAAHGVAVRSGPIFEGAVAVHALAFGPDGLSLASDTVGGMAVWFRADGEWTRRQLAVPRGTWDMAFTPDGRTLVTAGGDGLLRWDMDPASWQRKACQIAARNLTSQEWRQYLTFSSDGAARWLRYFDPRQRSTCSPYGN